MSAGAFNLDDLITQSSAAKGLDGQQAAESGTFDLDAMIADKAPVTQPQNATTVANMLALPAKSIEEFVAGTAAGTGVLMQSAEAKARQRAGQIGAILAPGATLDRSAYAPAGISKEFSGQEAGILGAPGATPLPQRQVRATLAPGVGGGSVLPPQPGALARLGKGLQDAGQFRVGEIQADMPSRALKPYTPEWFVRTIVSSLPQIGVSVAAATAGTAVGGPLAGLAAGAVPTFALEAGQAAQQIYEAKMRGGASNEEALADAFTPSVIVGLINSGIEQSGVQEAARSGVIKSGLVTGIKEWLKRSNEEGVEEVVQNLVTTIGQGLSSGEWPTASGLAQDSLQNYLGGFSAGGIVDAGMQAVGGGGQEAAPNMPPSAPASTSANVGAFNLDALIQQQQVRLGISKPVETGDGFAIKGRGLFEGAGADRPLMDSAQMSRSLATGDILPAPFVKPQTRGIAIKGRGQFTERAGTITPGDGAVAERAEPDAIPVTLLPDVEPSEVPAVEQTSTPGEAPVTTEQSTSASPDFATPEGVRRFLQEQGATELDSDEVGARVSEAQRVVDALEGRDTLTDPSLRDPNHQTDEARAKLRARAVDELMNNPRLGDDDQIRPGVGGSLPSTPLRTERKAFLVLGPTAAGKSGVSNQIAEATGSRILDNDYAKRKIPEFFSGLAGAALVHEESTLILDELMQRSLEAGENVVIPKLGSNSRKIAGFADALRANGYSVHVVSVQLAPQKAAVRAISRFLKSGRYVPVPMILEAGDKPADSYNELRNSGYEGTALSTDVRRGEPPQHLEGVRLEDLLQPDRDRGTADRPADRDAASDGQQQEALGNEGLTNERASNPERDGEPDVERPGQRVEEGAGVVRGDGAAGLDGGAEAVRPRQRPGSRAGRRRGAKSASGGVEVPAAEPESAPEPQPGGAEAGDESEVPRRVAPKRLSRDELKPEDRNHVVAEGDVVAPPSPSKKLAANIDALKLLKTLESEGRNPSPDEKKTLAQYTGWGWGSEILNENNPRYAKQRQALAGLMTTEELDAAKRSTLNAHYTSDKVVRPMWDLAKRLGFNGGRVLEPAAGSGNFFGMMPQDLADKSDLVGVELDSITGRLLRKLYPQADIRVEGFQDAALADNSFDLAISNVPFGGFKIAGKDYNTLLIHDYFFARGLDKVKPGGLVMFVTSDGTMNKLDSKVRKLLAEKADLVGAVRLPNNAFAENAGTQVTTDIIVLRKKDGTPFESQPWIDTVDVGTWKVDDGSEKPILVNEYFANNPDMALGKHSLAGTMYGRGEDYALLPDPRRVGELGKALREAIDRFPENVLGAQDRAVDYGAIKADEGDRPGSYLERDGAFVQVFGDQIVKADWLTQVNRGEKWQEPIDQATRTKRKQIARDYFGLRDVLRRLVRAEIDESATDAQLKTLRKELNDTYDAYVKKWGTLNRIREVDEKANFLSQDPEYSGLQALEQERQVTRVVQKGKNAGRAVTETNFEKAAIFTKRIREPKRMPTSAGSLDDAIAISLGYKNRIDPEAIASLLNLPVEQARRDLLASGRAFVDPESGVIQQREQYLSGNVRKKLERAKLAAESDPDFEPNVKALESVIPEDVHLSDISYTLASRWLPPEVTSAFASELFGTPVQATYVRAANGYNVDGGSGSVESQTSWAVLYNGRPKQTGIDILTHALNGTKPNLSVTVEDAFGKKRQIPLPAETAQARALVDKINREFVTWSRTSEARVQVDGKTLSVQQAIESRYNRQMNAVVPVEYDGSYLALPGVSSTVRRLPHRMSVVARILSERAGVMAHGVGSGKTYSQIVAAMELRRLGLARKPMIVVQKSTIGQFARSFRDAYPDAKILVATEKTFAAKNRKRLMAQVQHGDWDAIIVAHSQFDKVASSPKYIRGYIQRKLAELAEAIAHEQSRSQDEGNGRRKSPTLKQLEAMKSSLEERMAKAIDEAKSNQDQAAYFDELGVDFLLIDEAHAYKNTPIVTRKRNVKGIPSGYSQRALNTAIKAEFIQSKQGGRGIVMATGTPITNTMAEAYIMLSLAAPHVLRDYDISNFDEFADTFGQEKADVEYTWSGQFKSISRFKKFQNGPELVRLIRAGFDVKMGNKELGLKVPELKGGKPELVILDQTPAQEAVTDRLLDVADAFMSATGKEKMEMSWVPIMTMQAGMAAALDPRLVDPTAGDDPGSKVNIAAERIKSIYDEWNHRRGTQIVFADRFFPMNMEKLWAIAGGGRSDVTIDATDLDPEANVGIPEEENPNAAAEAEQAAFKTAKFNLYKDLKQKLIERGIPAAEIAIIHEANTDDRREALFDKVNKGEVRVIIGSTERLGVGVNIQERIVAMHHLDPPRTMTPAMKEQRDGRGIRQGNIFLEEKLADGSPNPDFVPDFRLENLQYGVKQTMDTGIWQLLENKQRFISQALMGRGVGRQFDDPADEALMSMAQMKAQLTGDKRVLRLVELKQLIDELRTAQEGHERAVAESRRKLDQADEDLASAEKTAADWERKKALATAASAEGIEVRYNGKSATGTEDIKDLLKGAWAEALARMERKMPASARRVTFEWGKFGGWIDSYVGGDKDGPVVKYDVGIADYGKAGFEVRAPGPGHFIAGIREIVKKADAQIAEANQRAKDAKAMIDKLRNQKTPEFERADELAEAEREMQQIERDLTGVGKPKATGVVLRPGERTRGSLVDRLDRVIQGASERMQRRRRARGVRLYSGFDPAMFADAVDAAILVGAKALKAGVTGGRKLTALISETLGSMKMPPDAAKVRSIAKGLIRDALDADGKPDGAKFERVVADLQRQADGARRRGAEPIKQTVKRVAGAPDDRNVRTPSEQEEGPKNLRTKLGYAEKAAARAYRSGVRQTLDSLKPFVADVAKQIRREQDRRLQMAKIEARGRTERAVARQQAMREAAMWYRDQLVERLKELPVSLRGRYIEAVKNAEGPMAVVRATKRMTRDLAKYEARSDMRKVTKMLRRRNLAKLTEDRRETARALGVRAGGVWSNIRSLRQAKPATADVITMAEDLRSLREQMAQVYAEHRAEHKRLKLLRGLSALDASWLATRNIEAARKPLKSPSREESPEVNWIRRRRNGSLDLRGALQAVEGKYDGTGILERVVWRSLARAESARFNRKRQLQARVDRAVKAAGFKGVTDAFDKLTRLGGVDEHMIVAKLGGQDRTIGLGEAVGLLANMTDPETMRLLSDGAPVQFDQGLYRSPIDATPVELLALQSRPEIAKYLPMIQEFKAILESIQPDTFRAHYIIKGFEPVRVKDRWPRSRNLEATDISKDLPESAGDFAKKMLENMGFLQSRGNNRTAPVIIRPVMDVMLDEIDKATKVAHLAVPIRDAVNVMLSPNVREAIAQRWGPRFYRSLTEVLWAASGANQLSGDVGARLVHELNANISVASLALNPRTWARQVAGSIRLIPILGEHWISGVTGAAGVSFADMTKHSGYLWERYVGNAAGRMSPVLVAGAAASTDSPTLLKAAGLTLRNLRARRVADAYRSWKGAGRRAMELLNFFDSVNARVAWAGFEAKAKAENPQWSPARRTRWVAERTSEAIRETQNGSSPVDLSLDATEARNSITAAAFLFTSEPYKTYNRLLRAKGKGRGEFVKVAGAEAAQILASAVMVQAIGWSVASAVSAALGGDDRDQERINRAIFAPQRLLLMAAQEVAGALGIPILGGALVSAVQGHASEGFTPSALGAVNDVFGETVRAIIAADKAIDDNSSAAADRFVIALERFISATLNATGVNPAQALWRQVWGEAKHHLADE